MIQRHGRGIVEIYRELLEEQNGVCAICGNGQVSGHSRLFVDHDHQTGEIRGLLCGPCNSGLGMFRDNLEALKSATKYLDQYVP
jgi:hypothetical protein